MYFINKEFKHKVPLIAVITLFISILIICAFAILANKYIIKLPHMVKMSATVNKRPYAVYITFFGDNY